ncbi:uncharacterized protein LOC122021141 [Zingiber officinale]|uniref:BAG domain-containing protein n=1 Tax=Zingiber officinale TaxID=94328 RepID=A0A8J5F605_ZINOF|nr:uncharacterized protein LOC122021141 [Zingiber officinale]KAG6479746.1 hypothetical protein ZIOFF_063218 [Zingiber officinale]
MESPFFFSNDPWSAAARRRPSGRGTQRPLFYVSDPWSAPHRYSGRTNQFPESAPTRAPEPSPAARPRVVSIPVHFGRSDDATEPAGPIRPETSKSDAAVAIQRVFRGNIVRKNIKILSQVALEVEEIEGRLRANEARLRVDSKERLQMNEMLMAQLLRLDSVRWAREYRRKVIRKVIALQEFLDAISVQIEESPNSVNSQASAEMNSNYVDSSGMSNDVVSNTISQDAICSVAEEVSPDSKDPILGSIEDGEDAEKKSDGNVSSDEGFKAQDSLACRNDSEEERMSEDEGFMVVAAEEATCNSPADVHSQKDPGLELTEQETCKVEAMEEVVQLPEDSARMTVEDEGFTVVAAEEATCNSLAGTDSQKDPGFEVTEQEMKEEATEEVVEMPEDSSWMTVKTGNGSTEVSGVEEALKKVMAESERLQELVAALCERNTEQCRLMAGLADRVGSLELAVQRMEKKNKKKRAKCSPVGKKGRYTK